MFEGTDPADGFLVPPADTDPATGLGLLKNALVQGSLPGYSDEAPVSNGRL